MISPSQQVLPNAAWTPTQLLSPSLNIFAIKSYALAHFISSPLNFTSPLMPLCPGRHKLQAIVYGCGTETAIDGDLLAAIGSTAGVGAFSLG